MSLVVLAAAARAMGAAASVVDADVAGAGRSRPEQADQPAGSQPDGRGMAGLGVGEPGAERADVVTFLAPPSQHQWQAPTLCTVWRVRDVVAHVISYDVLNTRVLQAFLVRGRFRPGRVNATALASRSG